jgi:hypothetical protein
MKISVNGLRYNLQPEDRIDESPPAANIIEAPLFERETSQQS